MKKTDIVIIGAGAVGSALARELSKYKLEVKTIKPVYPMADKEANMVLIEAVRGGKSMVKMEAPLIVYKEQGVYTDEIYDIYGY